MKKITRVNRVRGGKRKPVRVIHLIQSGGQSMLGTSLIDSLYDLHNRNNVTDLPYPAFEVEYDFDLDPPATYEAIHLGYEAEISSINSVAMTRIEANLRDLPDFTEKLLYQVRRPTKLILITLNFPRGVAPAFIDLKVFRNGQEDEAESIHAQSCLFYDKNVGTMFLRIPWVIPDHQYEVSWPIPEFSMSPGWRRLEHDAISNLNQLIHPNPKDPDRPINRELQTLKRELLGTGLLQDRNPSLEALEIGLFALPMDDKKIHAVAGTFPVTSGQWDYTLPWGTGVQGMALRRGKPEFFVYQGSSYSDIYRKPPNCPQDTYLLAVPLLLPIDFRPPTDEIPPGFFKAVMCLNSTSQSSGLSFLEVPSIREQVCIIMQCEFTNIMKRIIRLP